MVVDIGIVRNHIKPKADSTLRNMRKDDLIEYIRCLENNYNVAVSFNNQQAKYIESLGITEVVRCKDCKWRDTFGCAFVNANSIVRADNDYCSDGERRTNETE